MGNLGRTATVVFVWLVGVSVLGIEIAATKRDLARDERERARDDREAERDKRERARDQRELDRDDLQKAKRAPMQWEMKVSLAESWVAFTNFDANERRYICGFVAVTNKTTSVSTKSTELCSGPLQPHSTVTELLSFPVGALEHTCVSAEKGFTWDACSLEFVKTER